VPDILLTALLYRKDILSGRRRVARPGSLLGSVMLVTAVMISSPSPVRDLVIDG
jgi:hypothetical protein